MKALLFCCVLVAVNVLLWIWWMPRLLDEHISRFQNELVERHYREVEVMYRKMRGWRHDYRNHIQVLKAHMDMGRYAEASSYLDALEEDLTTVDTVLKTGNVVVDAILNSKLSLIREKGIRVDATAMVPQEIRVSGVDLSVIIGNLLDNAIEACERIDNSDERFIRIYIDVLKKQLYVSVTNATAEYVRRTGGRFRFVKEGAHGFGLLRVDGIVDKYNGLINRQTEDGVFATEITLPLAE